MNWRSYVGCSATSISKNPPEPWSFVRIPFHLSAPKNQNTSAAWDHIRLAMGDNPFFTWMNICFEWIILDFIWMNKIFEWIILDFFWTNKFFEWIICVLFWMNKFFEWIILLCDWMNYWMNNKKCIIHKKNE